MMSDLQGLITKSTSVTFQRIITPFVPAPVFSSAVTKGSDSESGEKKKTKKKVQGSDYSKKS